MSRINSDSYYCQVGPVSLLAEFDKRYSSVILANLREAKKEKSGTTPDLHFIIHSEGYKEKSSPQYSAGKYFQFWDSEFSFRGPSFYARVAGLFSKDEPSRVDVFLNKRFRSKKSIADFFSGIKSLVKKGKLDFNRRTDKAISTVMSYSLFWFVIHCALIKKGSSFIHASALERDGRVLLIAGSGGCGKTSTLFRMLENPHCSYLSEDFTILSKDGDVSFSPKTLSIYASDLRGNPSLLINYVKNNFRGVERNFWLYHRDRKGSNPLKKIAPEDVVGNSRICESSPLGAAYFLVRGQYSTLEARKIDSSEFSERSQDASYRELKTLAEIISLGRAVSGNYSNLPSVEEFRTSMKATIEEATKSKPCYLLTIPQNCPPDDVAKFLLGRTW
jgi:hypothetical protein